MACAGHSVSQWVQNAYIQVTSTVLLVTWIRLKRIPYIFRIVLVVLKTQRKPISYDCNRYLIILLKIHWKFQVNKVINLLFTLPYYTYCNIAGVLFLTEWPWWNIVWQQLNLNIYLFKITVYFSKEYNCQTRVSARSVTSMFGKWEIKLWNAFK